MQFKQIIKLTRPNFPGLQKDTTNSCSSVSYVTLLMLRYMYVQQCSKWQNWNPWETESVTSSWPWQRTDSGAQVAVHPFERHLVPFNFLFRAMVHIHQN